MKAEVYCKPFYEFRQIQTHLKKGCFWYTNQILMHAQNAHRRPVCILHVLAFSLACLALIPAVAAQSSWSPTLLVNTEAFQVIDDADTSSNISVRFGSTVNESIIWNRAIGMFQFSDDISVLGVLSGTSLRVDGVAAVHGALSASGAVRFDQNLTLNDDLTAADVVLTFGSDGVSEALSWINATDRFRLSNDLDVVGTISGTTIRSWGGIANTFSGSIITDASFSGSTFYGSGLGDCSNGTTSKLLYNPATGRFSCGTDQTGGGSGGNWSNTGSLNGFFDTKYVNVSGDTMTGALFIDLQGTSVGTGLVLREKAYLGSGAVLSGTLMLQSLQNTATPSQAPDGMLKTYSQTIAGRPLLQNRGRFGSGYALQPALFSKMVMSLTTGGGTTVNGIGTTVTNDTTVSHPAADQTFGYMTNFATAATLNDTAGTSSVNTTFFRGSAGVANGFFFSARVGVVDTASVRTFVGLANQTIATMVGNDNPAGHYIGFQFSTNRGDANWQFTTKDNTTQNVVNTTMPFTANNVYELSFNCTSTCTTVNWQIDNLTTGTRLQGSTASNLPGGSTSLRQVLGVSALTATAKNFRMQHVYTETDR